MPYKPSLPIFVFVLVAFLFENTAFILLDHAASQHQHAGRKPPFVSQALANPLIRQHSTIIKQ
jgi:hypothetical protein